MGVIWESLVSWAADPPGVLVYGPTLTAEVSGGPVVLRVLAVHTAEAVYLGKEAKIHTLLEGVVSWWYRALCWRNWCCALCHLHGWDLRLVQWYFQAKGCSEGWDLWWL